MMTTGQVCVGGTGEQNQLGGLHFALENFLMRARFSGGRKHSDRDSPEGSSLFVERFRVVNKLLAAARAFAFSTDAAHFAPPRFKFVYPLSLLCVLCPARMGKVEWCRLPSVVRVRFLAHIEMNEGRRSASFVISFDNSKK